MLKLFYSGTIPFFRVLPMAVLGFVLSMALSAAAQPIFWESEIALALDSRDLIYKQAGIPTAEFYKMRPGYSATGPLSSDTSTPWPFFLRGLSYAGDSAEVAALFFNKAIACTEKDPGRTWVLSEEFERCGLAGWQEKCLKKLELLFLACGAQSVPAISQQLLYKAAAMSAKGADNGSEIYNTWASRFDRDCIWTHIQVIESSGIFATAKVFPRLQAIADRILSSWKTQLVLARNIYEWFFILFLLAIAGILLGLSIKYIPWALHIPSERLPDKFSSKAKLFLAILIFASFIFLGLLFFVWCFFFIVWRHCSSKDKQLATVALVLFLLFPFGIKVEDMFDSALSPGGSVMLYEKTLNEGYYQQLDLSIRNRTISNNRDYLVHTAAALYSLKKGEPLSAFPHLKIAQRLFHDNPAVLIASGNALFYSGDLAGARDAFQECIKLYPAYEPAYFNLGQYYFNSMETAKGMDYITQATKLNPGYVNAFIKKNDECFSKEWPQLRQLLAPDFTPSYFWKNIFPDYCGTWNSASLRFGDLFFGMPLLWYIALSIMLFIIILLFDSQVWSKNAVKKVTACKLCQAIICRKCKRGSICRTCFSATQQIRNEQIRQRIMRKIQFKTLRLRFLQTTILDMVFPGAGMIFRSAPVYQSLLSIALTSMVYATYISLFRAAFDFPAWTAQGLVMQGCAVLALYNIFFVVRGFIKIAKELTKRGE
jgi:tetratricopeptide (TPR) repeat protein